MTIERLVTSADIARMLGVGNSAVANWRKRGARDIPAPDFTAGKDNSPLWRRETIEAWLTRQLTTAQDRLADFGSVE
jgi:hypothetical protein